MLEEDIEDLRSRKEALEGRLVKMNEETEEERNLRYKLEKSLLKWATKWKKNLS